MSDEKKGFIKRSTLGTARYVGRRFGNQFSNKVGRESVSEGLERARQTLTPAELDAEDFRAGLNGRYEDGGKKRFEEVMRETKTSEAQLATLVRTRRRSSIVMFAAAGGFLFVGAFMILRGETFSEGLYGFATAFMSLLFLALGISQDFSKWQIEERRFGGFKEYFSKKPDRSNSAPKTDIKAMPKSSKEKG